MDARSSSLQQLLWGANQYVIPVFQRYYSWRKRNWEQLWSDIEALLDPDEGTSRHFMGALVFVAHHPNPLTPRFLVIDGQQRLVTLSLLLCAIRNIAERRKYPALAAEIEDKYVVDKYHRDRDRLRILPRQLDREDYISIALDGGAVGGSIGQSLAYFAERLNVLTDSYAEAELRDLAEAITCGLDFVVVTLDNENPYQIFRSLNATGVPLSEADLIRNFVFMHVGADDIDSFDEQHWRHWRQGSRPARVVRTCSRPSSATSL